MSYEFQLRDFEAHPYRYLFPILTRLNRGFPLLHPPWSPECSFSLRMLDRGLYDGANGRFR